MILHNDRTGSSPGTGAISTIMREMTGLFDPADEAGCLAVREVATGVEAFLEAEDRVEAIGRVRALASRALICSGRKDQAGRLLLVGGGLVRMSRSVLVEDGVVLTLDLKKVDVKHDERLDLVFRRCLLLLVDSLAHMWDEAGGRGMLGLRNVRAATGVFLGFSAGPRQANLLAHETRAVCEGRLEALRRRRDWKECPMVLDLDWWAGAGRRRRRGNIT